MHITMKPLIRSCLLMLFVGLTACTTMNVDEPGSMASKGILVPSQEMVDAGNAAPLIRYNRYLSGGGHTWESASSGWQITHALAVAAGNRGADARMLKQLQYSLEPENCLSANGGYPAQHERHMTGAYTILKGTDFWISALSDEERKKITLLMKATLVASAYTTADASYEGPHSALDGDKNLNRGWNPNFREGMFGGLIHASVFFGGTEAARKILDEYNHEAFVAELENAGLKNTHETFNWAVAHPESAAPTGARIESNIHDYRYMGEAMKDPMEQLYALTVFTYGGTVNCGLNDGAGILWEGVPTGTIVTGCEALPNKGKSGMLKEFDGRDAGGSRSSIHYAYDGFRPNLTNHVVVLTGGYWKSGEESDEILSLMDVGITDLEYKLRHGYRNYAKKKGHAFVYDIDNRDFKPSFETTLPLWFEVLKPYHGI